MTSSQRGIVFTLGALAFFTIVFAAYALGILAVKTQSESVLALAQKINFAWDDVSEGITFATQLQITQEYENITFSEIIPATRDVANLLHAYGAFSKLAYASKDLEVKFLSLSGQEINLDQLQPPLTIYPSQINYTYPGGGGWGKRELGIEGPAASFSNLSSITVDLTLIDSWFNENLTGSCAADWDSYKNCTEGTQYCLHLNLVIVDKNGSSYSSPCLTLDVEFLNKIHVNLANENSSALWLEVRAGSFPTTVLNIRLQNIQINSSMKLSFAPGSSPYVNYAARLKVKDLNWNALKDKEI